MTRGGIPACGEVTLERVEKLPPTRVGVPGQRSTNRLTRSPFLSAKTRQPLPPAHFVRRERLLQLLDDLSADHPVTLVVAPAGAGKTALLADWAAHTELRPVWVTCDDLDADPGQLWTLVAAALERVEPEAVARAAPLFRTAARLEEAMGTLLDDLHATDTAPTALIIDNLHALDSSPAARESFAQLAQHLPPWLHLVLGSRRRPALPVDRMLANGSLAEVRFPELRLTPEEAHAMMARLSPEFPEDRLAAVVDRAKGWPAALQLAALAARSQRAAPVLGHDGPDGERLIDEYLWREVLQAESPDVVSVLLDTAAVDRISPSLAEALTGRADAADLLLDAEARGLFVTRLERGGWFQVHALVREVLLAEAERRSPDRLRSQHRRAARWFEELGEFPAAVDHWLAADEPRDALRLLSASLPELYDSGRQATFLRMVGRIHPTVVGADPVALMQYAFCQLLVSQSGFIDTVATLGEVLGRTEDVDDLTARRAQVFQGHAAMMTGAFADGERAARQGLKDLGPAAAQDPFLRFGWSVVARAIALEERWDEHGADVQEMRRQLSMDPERRTAWEGIRALGLVLAGRPTDAIRVAAGVRRMADVSNMTALRAEIDIADALVQHELGDAERAAAQLERLAAEPVAPVSHPQALARLWQVDSALVLGDVDAAQRALVDAEALVHELWPGEGGRSRVATRGTAVALARDDLDAAQQWCERNSDLFWGPVGRARLLLAQGRGPEALDELGTARRLCVRHEVVHGLLTGRALSDREAAVKAVATAIERAADTGMLATVAAEGEEVLALAEVGTWGVPQAWMDRLRRAAAPRVEADKAPGQVERLTEREQDVLRLLPSRLTLREIADELFVSQNTLKFHLRVIYRKLGVNSRADAVEVGRRMRARRR